MADTVLLVCSLGLNFLGAAGLGWKFYMDKTKNTTGKRETDFMDNALAAMEVLNTGDGLSSTLNDGSLILSEEAQQIQQKLYSLVSGTVALLGWKTLFERRATDASSLDLDIFTQVIREDCQIPTSELNSVQVPQIFKQIDTDKSGTVSLDEFLAWLAEDTEKTPKRLQGRLKRAMKGMDEATGWQAVFDSFDTDGSGELDLEEFIQAIRVNCGEEMARRDVWIPNEQLTALFKAADVDNSGELDYEEFLELMRYEKPLPALTIAELNDKAAAAGCSKESIDTVLNDSGGDELKRALISLIRGGSEGDIEEL